MSDFDLADNYRALVAALIASEVAGKPQHELILELGATPEILVKHGFRLLPLVLKGKTVSKMHFDHGMVRSLIERLPELIACPKAIYRSTTSGAVVVTFEVKGVAGHPIIIAVHADKQVGRDRVVNEVASMYAKEGPNPETRWKAQGLLIWENQITEGKKAP